MLLERSIKERKDKTPDQALASLMRLCARAEKSSGDALRLMRTWGVSEAARQGVLQKLIDQRFINDVRYAGAFVREKTRLSGWGARKIRSALQRKGIDQTIIDTALADFDPAQTAERLSTQLKRKMRSVRYTSPYDLKNKLMRYGLSLGYEYDTIIETISKLINAPNEDCSDFL